jgi:cobalamin biosynthesis protein CobD/CbiB
MTTGAFVTPPLDIVLPFPDYLDNRVFLFFQCLYILFALRILFFPINAPAKPIFLKALDFLLLPIIDKLNRKERSPFALSVRGMIVLLVFSLIFISLQQYIRMYGVLTFITMLIIMMSPFATIKLALSFARQKKVSDKILYNLSNSTYVNLIHHDEYGLNRHVINAITLAFVQYLIAPFIVFCIFAYYGLFIYYISLAIMNLAGRSGYGGYFATIPKAILYPVFFISQYLAAFILYLASLFAGKKSTLSNFGNILKLNKVKKVHVFEGGAAMKMMALALDSTLGGPYQDKSGNSVSRAWVGAEGTSSQVKKSDVFRAIYLTFVAILLVILLSFLFAYVAKSLPDNKINDNPLYSMIAKPPEPSLLERLLAPLSPSR